MLRTVGLSCELGMAWAFGFQAMIVTLTLVCGRGKNFTHNRHLLWENYKIKCFTNVQEEAARFLPSPPSSPSLLPSPLPSPSFPLLSTVSSQLCISQSVSCSPGQPPTYSKLPASASQRARMMALTTTPASWLGLIFVFVFVLNWVTPHKTYRFLSFIKMLQLLHVYKKPPQYTLVCITQLISSCLLFVLFFVYFPNFQQLLEQVI